MFFKRDKNKHLNRKSVWDTNAVLQSISKNISIGNYSAIKKQISKIYPSEVAYIIDSLGTDERIKFLKNLSSVLPAEAYYYIDDSLKEQVLGLISKKNLAKLISGLDTDDGVEILEELEPQYREEILKFISSNDKFKYQENLSFPRDSAGRIMNHAYFSVPSYWKVGDIFDYMGDNNIKKPDHIHNIILVSPSGKPVRVISLDKIISAKRGKKLLDLIETEPIIAPASLDQEEIALLFKRYAITELPVVNDAKQLIGTINLQDVIDVVEQETSEDILQTVGLSEDDFYLDVLNTVKSRSPWLFINLGTAFLASLVIGVFATTIQKSIALAVILPIIASMGGNAGGQALIVSIRAFATNKLSKFNFYKAILKEAIVGFINGCIFAAIAFIGTIVWLANIKISIITSVAVFINLIIASLAGIMIPIVLTRLNIDPAISASVLLTAITDILGFFVFLGLATLLIYSVI